MNEVKQWTTGATVMITKCPFMTYRGRARFCASGENRSGAWNKQFPGVLTQALIEEWAVEAILKGYDRDMELKVNEDDLEAYSYSNNFIYRERILIADGKVTILESEYGPKASVV